MIPYKAQASNPSRSGDTALSCPTYCLSSVVLPSSILFSESFFAKTLN